MVARTVRVPHGVLSFELFSREGGLICSPLGHLFVHLLFSFEGAAQV